MNTVDLGSLIRLKRKEKGLNQKNLADLLHVSAAAVNKWENGKNSPDFGNLQALSVLLEIPIADLLGGFPQSPKLESDAGNVTSESDLQSSSPPKDLSSPDQSLPEQPENPAPQSEDPPEPSDTAIPDIEDTAFLETPILPLSQPEDVSEPPPSIRKRIRLKIAIPLLMFLLMGIIVVCWVAGEMKSIPPSYTVCDAYHGDFNGEYVYYIIAEFESEPTPDDFIDFNYIIEEKYEQYFSEVSKIVVIYTQDYINYIENGFDDTVDVMGIIFPH